MTTNAAARVAQHAPAGSMLRETYWEARKLASELGRLLAPDRRPFLRHAMKDQLRYLTGAVRPVRGEAEARARAAVEWLLHAQRSTPDDGVSLGFFPSCPQPGGWMPSYPETTGYIVTTLLAYADAFRAPHVRDAALRMAEWEITIQMPSGAVQGGPVGDPAGQTAAAFNTGMVLDGWCSAYEAAADRRFLDASRRAADFLTADLDDSHYFRTNGAYVSGGEIKTYTCLCAWAMYRFGRVAGDRKYCEAALKVVDAALLQQQPNGWFRHNCLTRSSAPLTHTLGYTLQGVLEVGLLAGRRDYLEAVRRGLDPLLARVSAHGLLAARFREEWQAATRYSCLTGNAQIAIVCFRLYAHTGERHYKEAGDRLVDALKALQALDSPIRAVNGALPGSFPLLGGYMRAGYPNWATKYLVDALLLQVAAERPDDGPGTGGTATRTPNGSARQWRDGWSRADAGL